MSFPRIFLNVAAGVLLLAANQSVSFAQFADHPALAPTRVAPEAAVKRQSVAPKPLKGKLVDINSANKRALMKLPGITEVDADKIIAGRPYGSKAWLVTKNVLVDGRYAAIKDKIIAKQPFKTAKENAAYYEKLGK